MALFDTKKIKEQTNQNKTIKLLIECGRLSILIHSCIYYHFNQSIKTDAEFDEMGKVLSKLHRENPKIAENANYGEGFEEYNSDCYSGFNLPYTDPIIIQGARNLLNIKKI